MKLLLDQNVSPRLCVALSDLFPNSAHVRELGLRKADDTVIWTYAAQHGFAIVTKDADFRQRSFLLGHPPKIVWLRLGNCSTKAIEALLRSRLPRLKHSSPMSRSLSWFFPEGRARTHSARRGKRATSL